jgi:hypothetical protein
VRGGLERGSLFERQFEGLSEQHDSLSSRHTTDASFQIANGASADRCSLGEDFMRQTGS